MIMAMPLEYSSMYQYKVDELIAMLLGSFSAETNLMDRYNIILVTNWYLLLSFQMKFKYHYHTREAL